MKHLGLFFLISVFSFNFSFAQVGIGASFGVNPAITLRSNLEEVEIEGITDIGFARYGIYLNYKHQDFLHFRTGTEFFSRGFNAYNSETRESYNYSLDYVQIPLNVGVDVLRSESFSSIFFIYTEVGLGIDILRSEMLNGLEADTGFNRIGVVPRFGSYFGLEAWEKLRCTLGVNIQYSLLNTMNNDVIGKGHGTYYVAEWNFTYYFLR